MRILFFLGVILIFGCNKNVIPVPTATELIPTETNGDDITKSDNIDALVTTMIGSYNSAHQAAKDSTYLDISLHMYPIWESDTEAKWLYVEQAETINPTQPYRQRVYKLMSDGKGSFESHIYTLNEPDLFIGKWSEPKSFDLYNLDILTEKKGCTVYITPHADGSYSGSTRLDHCKSTMNGATYATSLVKIRDGSVFSLDQGFDANGNQVWGVEKGGYLFKKL